MSEYLTGNHDAVIRFDTNKACGCGIVVSSMGSDKWGVDDIAYCPTHKAAPTLLAAILAYFAAGSERSEYAARERMRDAVELATGERPQ